MLKILKYPLGTLEANCYILYEEKLRNAWIVDPSDDADFISSIILKNQLIVNMIIATHGHFDHILAAFELQNAFNVPFCINKKDKFLIDRLEESVKHFLNYKFRVFKPIINRELKNGEILQLGKYKFKVLETPGHTPGSISLYCKSKNLIFSGDVIFEGGYIGRTDFKYSNAKDLEVSINKIKNIDKNLRVYSGHGNDFTVSK